MTNDTLSALSIISCREEFANAGGMNRHWMAMHCGVNIEPFRAPADDDPSPDILDLPSRPPRPSQPPVLHPTTARVF
jgi:hypothetical protein